jgi:predicted metal-binding membrane protein
LALGLPTEKLAVGSIAASLALLSWIVIALGANAPVTGAIDSLALLLFVGVWAVGMVAMMLPSCFQ